MVKFLSTLFLIFLGWSTSAQEVMVFPKWRIGVTPTALVNLYPGLQMSIDKRLNERINLTCETAYLFTSIEEQQGIRIRPGVEIFLARSSWVSYVCGVNLTHRFTRGQVVRPTIATNGEFNFLNYRKLETMLTGMNLSNQLLFKLNSRTYLEAGGGIGIGRLTTELKGDETEFFTVNRMLARSTTPHPIVYAHLNISYALGR
ncbi:hypothetical protein [Portibacter marinus]|uniref:hypothetical protein n=1 Tax=Portibacter marinus TaxID=2898660 RepID=UPI001F275F58|nr:hypothetical protein [Portibacter marinus]